MINKRLERELIGNQIYELDKLSTRAKVCLLTLIKESFKEKGLLAPHYGAPCKLRGCGKKTLEEFKKIKLQLDHIESSL